MFAAEVSYAPAADRPHRRAVTAQPQPRTTFRKGIAGRWVFHAELAAREVGNLTLVRLCLSPGSAVAPLLRAISNCHA
jgi:hypothetical protein